MRLAQFCNYILSDTPHFSIGMVLLASPQFIMHSYLVLHLKLTRFLSVSFIFNCSHLHPIPS